MKIFFICSFIASIILLNGCNIYSFRHGLKSQTLLMMQLNMPENVFDNLKTEDEIPIAEFNLDVIKEHKVDVRVFKKLNGQDISFYFIAFSDGKLLYWGYPYEFARHSDKFINQVGKLAYQKYSLLK